MAIKSSEYGKMGCTVYIGNGQIVMSYADGNWHAKIVNSNNIKRVVWETHGHPGKVSTFVAAMEALEHGEATID